MIFLLSIRFLDDRYHGLTDNAKKAEWPPSPFRVFQALVAGNVRGGKLPDSVENALRWLESLAPPDIIAPQTRPGPVLLTYVLNNVSDSNPNSRAPKTMRPTLLNGDRLVQYAWGIDASQTDTREHAETLKRAARHINAVGWGIDLAIGHGEIVEHLPPPIESRVQYRPTAAGLIGGLDLRVPRRDSLVSLKSTYADFLKRYESPSITKLESAGAIFEPQRYVVGIARPNVAFRLVNLDGDTTSIRHQLIAPLVGMVRALTNRPHVVASLGQEVIDREIKGHPYESSGDRVSILPLPTIRRGPTDGRVRRLILAQPFESDGALCRELGQLFDGEELEPLGGEERFPRLFLERIIGRDTIVPSYIGVSRVWTSVTPVLLPGYDDRKEHRGNHQKRLARAEQLVQKALGQAGTLHSAHIELSRVPYWTGSLHSQEYQPRARLAHYPRWHVRLTFDRPLTGPLAIGAGRHCGFGVFARMDVA
ncbi:MAG: type I-U CRISPR-associated protein Csb2 [Acidobacteriota bacterium]